MKSSKKGFKGLKSYALMGGALVALSLGACNKGGGGSDNPAAPTAVTPTATPGAPAATNNTTTTVSDVDNAVVTASALSLTVPSKLALIPPQQKSASLALSDEENSEQEVFVEEKSLEALASAEQIMCYIAQTKFAEMANKGPYVALVNSAECEDSGAKDGGGSSNEVQLMPFTMESVKAENKALVARGMVEPGDGGKIGIFLKVAEGPSKKNPIGIFRFSWGFHDGEGAAVEGQGGLIESRRAPESGAVSLKFLENQNYEEGERKSSKYITAGALMSFDASGNIIGGKVSTSKESSEGTKTGSAIYQVAFNDDFILRNGTVDETASNKCLSRDNFNSKVYRYGLLNADGTKKLLNSGFPAEVDVNGETYQAHMSYWGLWSEGDNDLANGSKIYKVAWKDGEKSRTEYTLAKSPGKLFKYNSAEITLGELKGVDMTYWSNSDSKRFRVQWDGTNFVKKAELTYGDNGNDTETTATGNVTAEEWGGYHFNVESLSTGININSTDVSSQGDNLKIKYFVRNLVSGSSDVPSEELYCFDRCPKITPTAEELKSSTWDAAYNTISVDFGGGASQSSSSKDLTSPIKTYTFDSATQNLKDGSTAFAIPSGISSDDAKSMQGIHSGALVPKTAYDALTDKTIAGRMLEQSITSFYRWEAGASPWNQFQGVKDAEGSYVQFDKPLQFAYAHAKDSDFDGADSHDAYGKTFRIEYGGFGQLWGIPWNYDSASQDHEPEFSIAEGTKLGDYTVFPLSIAQEPAETEEANCVALNLDAMPDKPTKADLIAVEIPASVKADDIPVLVIEGEISSEE